MAHSMDTVVTTDSQTLVMDKTISSTVVSPLPSSILRSEEQDVLLLLGGGVDEGDIERQLISTVFRPGYNVNPSTTSSSSSSPPPTLFSKKFLDKGDPEVARARAIYFRSYFVGMGMMILTIFVVFSIYWGSLWRVPAHSLQGWIVDFDGGDVGEVVTQGLLNSRSWMVHWRVEPAERYPRGVDDVVQAIRDDLVWVVVSINHGSSLNLQNALSSFEMTYNGSSAITVFASEARNENAFRNLIRPAIQASLDTIKEQYALQFASRVASLSSVDLPIILSTSPQIITNPISYTLVNLIPFNQPVASAVVFVGLIYLLILSFYIVMIAHGAREVAGLNRMLQLKSLIALRMTSSFLGYFFLSFFYTLLNLAFKLDVTRKYGRGGFVILWVLNYIGMLSVGLALESLITVLTARFIPFFMILWIIVDVSVCIFPIEVLPGIYHYGYAAPFYNISRSTRSIVFGTKNTLALNFGVLFVWVMISCITLPTFQWLARRREERGETMVQVREGVSTPAVVVGMKQEHSFKKMDG